MIKSISTKEDREIENKKSRVQTRHIMFYASLILYPVIQWAIFWLYVNVDTIALTFMQNGAEGLEFAGLKNYIDIVPKFFSEEYPEFHNGFLNSFHAIFINIIILPLAIISSFAFYKRVPFVKFFRVMFYLPSMVSMLVLTMSFRYLFENNLNTFVGPVAFVFKSIGVDISWLDLTGPSATFWPLVYIYAIWSGLGVNVIMMCGAMQRISEEVIDAGKLDGLGFWRELCQVAVPLIMPTVGVFVFSGVVSVFSFTYQPMFLAMSCQTSGGYNYQAYTLGWYIFDQIRSGVTGRINAATVGISWSLIMLPLILLVKFALNKITPDIEY